MSFSLSAVLAQVCGSNGVMSAGIAAATEVGTAYDKRIPVPRNLHQGILINGMSLLRIAKWAYDFVLTEDPIAAPRAVAAYVTWICGGVALKGRPNGAMPETRAGLEALKWDTEIRVVDSDVLNINQDIDEAEYSSFSVNTAYSVNNSPPENHQELLNRVLTHIVAAKLTWWTTQHHLGSKLDSAEDGRTYQGYLEKVTKLMPIKDHDYSSKSRLDNLYAMVHPFSTLSMFKQLHHGTRIADDIRVISVVPWVLTNGAYTPTKFQKIEVSSDVQLRLNSFGAGYARLADVYAALRHLAVFPLFPLCPGIEQIGAFCQEYAKVKANPFKYSVHSSHLTLTTTSSTFDASPYARLIAAVHAYVYIIHPKSSLRRAAIFKNDWKNHEEADSTWGNYLTAFALSRARATPASTETVNRVLAIATESAYAQLSETAIQELRTIGINIDLDRLRMFSAAIKPVTAAQPAIAITPPAPAAPGS